MGSSSSFLQENRFLFLNTPLEQNKLLLESFTGHEGISQLFSFQLELFSDDNKVDFSELLGKPVHFGVLGPEGAPHRDVQGIVTAFAQLPSRGRVARYRAVVSPTIWKLTRKRQSRIFQQLSVPDILRHVLQGFEVHYDLRGAYPRREYCVQYRESDFEFISRLMEEEGIYYFFAPGFDGDELMLADTSVSNADIQGQSTLVYEELEGGERGETRIFDWQKTQCWDSGKCTLRDHIFEMPHNHLEVDKEILPTAQVGKVTHKLNVNGNSPEFEVYDYPGGYAKHYEGGKGDDLSDLLVEDTALVKVEMERIEAAQFIIRGQSNVYTLIPGYRFTLDRHFNGDGQYVITSLTHAAREGAFASGTEGTGEDHYSNIFTCIPSAIPYRPQRSTPKPHVQGCQTAYVVGPSGEEIYTDQYGRVKVQFHWDRAGANDDKSSCWVRVASFWAGRKWGAIHLPRIGQEVIVDFMEGDPDRPIVVGSVYNAENMPPYQLPDNKTQSTLKSRSSPGGGDNNFNEIRFEDKTGSEEVYFQAEKDLKSLIKNDESREVKHDRKVKIGNDDSKEVTHDLKLTVNHDRTATIANNDSETVGKDQTINITGKRTTTIAQDNSETITGADKLTVAQTQTVTIAANESRTTGASRSTKIGASDSTLVGGSVTLTAGGGVTITSGGPISITAPMVTITAAMVQCAGVVQCTSLIASAGVVSPVYSPGVGNLI